MQNYIIMTDSCCDLPAQLAQDLALHVLPLTVTIDDKSYGNYLDGREISHKDFYQQLREGKMPTTSALSVGQCEDAMRAILKEGKDLVIIAFSSALSSLEQSGTVLFSGSLHAQLLVPSFREHLRLAYACLRMCVHKADEWFQPIVGNKNV